MRQRPDKAVDFARWIKESSEALTPLQLDDAKKHLANLKKKKGR